MFDNRRLLYIPVAGDVHYDNIITGYESPRFIGYINNAVLQERFELILERQDNQLYPCQLKVKVYSRRRSYLMHVRYPGFYGLALD